MWPYIWTSSKLLYVYSRLRFGVVNLVKKGFKFVLWKENL